MPSSRPAPGVEGFFLAVGFGGHGFQHSPMTGRSGRRWIVDGNHRWTCRSSTLADSRRMPTFPDETHEDKPDAPNETVKIVVPDDYLARAGRARGRGSAPEVGSGAGVHRAWRRQEATLIERVGDARWSSTSARHGPLHNRVLAACPALRSHLDTGARGRTTWISPPVALAASRSRTRPRQRARARRAHDRAHARDHPSASRPWTRTCARDSGREGS
jgi:hypothetical protein